jgi:transcriptional regulator with XRE-family HTH domain
MAATGEARSIRESARVSRQTLADAIDVEAGTLARWERGERTPRPDSALRWAEVLEALMTSVDRDHGSEPAEQHSRNPTQEG